MRRDWRRSEGTYVPIDVSGSSVAVRLERLQTPMTVGGSRNAHGVSVERLGKTLRVTLNIIPSPMTGVGTGLVCGGGGGGYLRGRGDGFWPIDVQFVDLSCHWGLIQPPWFCPIFWLEETRVLNIANFKKRPAAVQ